MNNFYSKIKIITTIVFTIALLLLNLKAKAQTALNFVEVLKQGINNVTGLSDVSDIAVSADGKFVYSAAHLYSNVACFSRDILTGKLTFTGVTGITSAFSIDASSDNKSIYVASPSGNITSFSRDLTTGALSFVNTVKAGVGNTMTMKGFVAVHVSPDGKWVYGIGASSVKGIAVFSRDMETGAITFVEQHLNGVNGNLLDQDFWPTLSPIKNIATSADGKFLYVTATVSNTVSVYSIDQMTGRLTLVVVYVDGVDGIDGLQGASSLLLSPDGKHLYVSGQKENAVAIFNVNQTTGRLTYLNKLAQGVGGITSLNGVRSLAINPDGKYLYASAISSNAVTAFSRDVSTGLLTVNTVFTNGVGGIADLSAPSGMMMDPLSRNLYVSGQNSASIVVFESPVPAVVLSTNEVTTSNNVAVFLDPTLDIKDADSDNLRSATVKITNGMNTDLLSVAVQNGVSASYDANTRTLSLVGIASLSQYIDILRSLSYTPSLDPSVTPGTTSYRTISISVVDEENNSSADAIISVKINPENKVQTITFPAIADKFYGDPDFNIIAQSSNPLQAITYTSSDIDIAEIVAGLIKIKKAGTVTITATQDANSGFDAAIPVSQTLTVKKAPLGITADAQSKVYGTNDPSLTYQITSGKLIGSDVLTGALARDTGENVGTYAINQGTLNASENYDFTYKKADFDITKASLTVTADPQSKVYGSTDPRLTYQITAGKLIGSDVLTGNLSRVSG
ncbi:beta-propeller fold lactonase family protein, partial [Empedobacter falsenii]|uniref:beta-propeller fold lactonase family protein n=1 Tax=Empedobacter falsenii TaxID=343874 RepID=UPI003A80E35F